MQKTQLTTLIERMDISIAELNKKINPPKNFSNSIPEAMVKAIEIIRAEAIELLPKEREDMMNMYHIGYDDAQTDSERHILLESNNFTQYKP